MTGPFDFLFGAIYAGGALCGYDAAAQANAALALENAAWHALPRRVIPAGITWERIGPREHRVTIRREPETVVDMSGLGAA